ncbi:hypothetical protein T1E_4019 [Pseudomonas putida DOT-T1E]|uniref:Uncharacterized protein n=1 Tax=Pseudomonas putida (strain DOT-T1E) TaxID=1196325 RepID=I7CD76_PSEPT|nr:hypothetical protein T1E_4019 [Pseudomonas putida DOT-T1E]
MQIHLLFKKALLAAAVAGVLSMSIALIPDSISHGSSASCALQPRGSHRSFIYARYSPWCTA